METKYEELFEAIYELMLSSTNQNHSAELNKILEGAAKKCDDEIKKAAGRAHLIPKFPYTTTVRAFKISKILLNPADFGSILLGNVEGVGLVAATVNPEYLHDNNPVNGGYYVEYPGGTATFMTEATFNNEILGIDPSAILEALKITAITESMVSRYINVSAGPEYVNATCEESELDHATLEDEDGRQVCVDAEYMQKHSPQIGGYYIKYADGRETFMSEEVFKRDMGQ